MQSIYPHQNDPDFNNKIHAKKEFRDYAYSSNITKDINKEFDALCNSDFELTNHQIFVKNFMASNTPYKSLLLYHGLGTGKTCSAISIAEEVRRYYKQTGFNKRIIIVASPNVQNNFKIQLFDDNKLIKINNKWSVHNSCIGNGIIELLFPVDHTNLTKDQVISAVNRFINTTYLFMGYIEFANYIKKVHSKNISLVTDLKTPNSNLLKEFSNRLIIIDEIHNMKNTKFNDSESSTHTATYLKLLIEHVQTLKLIFLTATPMFNSHKEIIWLLNLMRLNDNRPQIKESSIFDENANFLVNENGEETGLSKFIDMSRGYVSYVRGENPYSFPFRIYPSIHSPLVSSNNIFSEEHYPNYSPSRQLISSTQNIQFIDLYLNYLSKESYQLQSYYRLKSLHISETTKLLKYDQISPLIQVLNFAFPHANSNESISSSLIGSEGLNRVMSYSNKKFSYKYSSLGKIFHPDEIHKYSHKLKTISDCILNSEGVVLIYSQFIEGGLIPVALMLEEMGFQKYGGASLLNNRKSTTIFKYIIISGNEKYSPENDKEVAVATSDNNISGQIIKVILISKAGSEGIDFKFIRQIHILDPWYNLNRNEQIIGRGVRMCSHKLLPFNKRNVSIYLHSTMLPNINEEACDLYLYRLAESKALKIANISRILKRNSVDCMLNIKQTLFTEANFDHIIPITLSNRNEYDYKIGDKSFSLFCDFQRSCEYKCINNSDYNVTNSPLDPDFSTYSSSHLEYNSDTLIHKIQLFFSTHHFYSTIQNIIIHFSTYPRDIVLYSIFKIIDDKIIIYDHLNRPGTLSNFGEFIIYKPNDIPNSAPLFDRSHPPTFKHSSISFKYSPSFSNNTNNVSNKTDETNVSIVSKVVSLFTQAFDFSIQDNPKYESNIQEAVRNRFWYGTDNKILSVLLKHNIPIDSLYYIFCHHVVDSLNVNDKIYIFNFSNKLPPNLDSNTTLFFSNISKIVSDTSFPFQNSRALMLHKDNIASLLYVLHEDTWKLADFNQIKFYKTNYKSAIYKFKEQLDSQTNYIGFVDQNKNDFLFKIKDMKDPLNRGFRCDQSTRQKSSSICSNLFSLSPEYKLSPLLLTNLKTFEICVYIELLLRYYQYIQKNNQIWFISSINVLTLPTYIKLLKQITT